MDRAENAAQPRHLGPTVWPGALGGGEGRRADRAQRVLLVVLKSYCFTPSVTIANAELPAVIDSGEARCRVNGHRGVPVGGRWCCPLVADKNWLWHTFGDGLS